MRSWSVGPQTTCGSAPGGDDRQLIAQPHAFDQPPALGLGRLEPAGATSLAFMLDELSTTSTTRRALCLLPAEDRVGQREDQERQEDASCKSSDSRCRSLCQSDRGFFSSKICCQKRSVETGNPAQADLQDVKDDDRQWPGRASKSAAGLTRLMRALPPPASCAAAARQRGSRCSNACCRSHRRCNTA